LSGDSNGHINTKVDGYDRTYGAFGYGERNSEGTSILDFAIAYNLMVINSHFKEEDHLVTFRNGITKSQIGYFLIRANNRIQCKDCKVIPSEYLGTQHKRLVMDVVIKISKMKKRSVGDPKLR